MTDGQDDARSVDPRDRRHLERARELARRGWGRVHPNPMVGCVLVRGDRVVGEAHHREFGGPHAEVLALREAGGEARGATAYVSLEPCDHQGKTPPCSRALLEAGVARVVFGAADPGRKSGGGARSLQAAGVEVVGPVLSPREGRLENPAFFHAAEDDLPYLAVKLAISLDGRISGKVGQGTPVTGPEALRAVHRLRGGFDAILVGSRTARVDDPRLTVRTDRPPSTSPTRVVLDSGCRLDPEAALFQEVDRNPLVVFCAPEAPDDRKRSLEAGGAEVVEVSSAPGGLVLSEVLAKCRERGLGAILCEGGGVLATSLLREDRVHRLYLFVAPRFFGGEAVPAFPDPPLRRGPEGWTALEEGGTFGRDALVVFHREG